MALALFAGCGGSSGTGGGSTDAAPDVQFTVRDGSEGVDASVTPPDASAPEAAAPDSATDAPLGPPYPIILHHGFAGFRDLGPLNYFYNVAADLRSRGETVYESVVSPFDDSSVRAPQLAAYVDQALRETRRGRVILVAHSQGGLDARYLISRLGYADRVALLVTVSTPHRGTRVADLFDASIPVVSDVLLNALATLLGVSYNEARSNAHLRASLVALSQANAQAFNNATPDDPRVTYWSWAGRSNLRTGDAQCAGGHFPNDPSHVDATNVLLAPFALYQEQGDPAMHVNDGMVEVQSARWGLFQGCIPADHFDEVGQIAQRGPTAAGFDHLAFYRGIAQQARAAGF